MRLGPSWPSFPALSSLVTSVIWRSPPGEAGGGFPYWKHTWKWKFAHNQNTSETRVPSSFLFMFGEATSGGEMSILSLGSASRAQHSSRPWTTHDQENSSPNPILIWIQPSTLVGIQPSQGIVITQNGKTHRENHLSLMDRKCPVSSSSIMELPRLSSCPSHSLRAQRPTVWANPWPWPNRPSWRGYSWPRYR